jgi:hypothetical protein
MRIWRFSKKNIYITGIIYLIIFAQFGTALAYCVSASKLPNLVQLPELYLLASLALGGGLMTDVVIAAALCFFLRRLRTGSKRSDNLVNTLSIYAINTGALTGAIALLTLVLYDTYSGAFYFMAPYFLLGKLYVISFLCTLNTRKVLTGRGTELQGNFYHERNNVYKMTTSAYTPRDHEHSGVKTLETGVSQEFLIHSIRSIPPA